MTSTLVTGGGGFIGSHVAEALLKRGDRVILLDNFNDYYDPRRKERNIGPLLSFPNTRLVRGDIRDEAVVERIFTEESIDKVIHIAAMAGVRPSIERPLLYQDVNVRGLLVVLEACRRHRVSGFVFASTSSVYGADAPVPFREDDPAVHQVSPYAATKRAGELLCRTYHELFSIPTTCLRFFTVYGPRGRPDMAPYLFTQRVLAGQPIRMFGDGSSSRDYTYIDDIVAGVVAAVDAELPFEIINLGNAEPISLRDFIATVERATGKRATVRREPMQPGDVPRTFADISKARRLLGYEPSTSIEEGLQRFVDWYRAEVLAHDNHMAAD